MSRVGFLYIALVILLSSCYTYNKGLQQGEDRYKQSRRMYFALKSAYHYGYQDAKEGRKEDWDGPELEYFCTDCTAPIICWSGVECK